jgi:hypothetical protein
MLSMPAHIIAGDHDMAQGGLDAFYAGLACGTLPRAPGGRSMGRPTCVLWCRADVP